MCTNRWIRCVVFGAAAVAVAILVACGGPSGGNTIDPADLEAPNAEDLGRKLLERFKRTIDLEALTVEVDRKASEPRVLRFEYYTPLGDKNFTIAISRDGNTWRADVGDVIAVEKRFSR